MSIGCSLLILFLFLLLALFFYVRNDKFLVFCFLIQFNLAFFLLLVSMLPILLVFGISASILLSRQLTFVSCQDKIILQHFFIMIPLNLTQLNGLINFVLVLFLVVIITGLIDYHTDIKLVSALDGELLTFLLLFLGSEVIVFRVLILPFRMDH